MSSKKSDRGWNIVGGKARREWVAKILGASRSDEINLWTVAMLFALIIALWYAIQSGAI